MPVPQAPARSTNFIEATEKLMVAVFCEVQTLPFALVSKLTELVD